VSKKGSCYQRIILKLSGEAFSSQQSIELIGNQILDAAKLGMEIGVVVGGGNLIRGKSAAGIERKIADRIGLIATLVNGLILENLLKKSAKVRHLSTLPIHSIVETYLPELAIDALKTKHILVLSGGTGNIYFTTDTAAALRATELNASLLIKGTKVDGVYSADPQKNPSAVKYDKITYKQALSQDLKIMDSTAFALCQENKIPIAVINIFKPKTLKKVLLGEKIGSIIC
jgi:uridylate kinase